MKPLLIVTILLVFLSSCASLKISDDKKASVKDLSIDWVYSESVDSIYIPNIDSVMIAAMFSFNSHNHGFKIHKKMVGEQDGLTINFSRGKFTGDGEITASYIVSAIGLIATPIAVLSATNSQGVAFFWYFAADRIRVKASLSPTLAGKNSKTVKDYIQAGATFSNKSARMDRMCGKINDYVYSILLKLDEGSSNP